MGRDLSESDVLLLRARHDSLKLLFGDELHLGRVDAEVEDVVDTTDSVGRHGGKRVMKPLAINDKLVLVPAQSTAFVSRERGRGGSQ